MKHDYYSYTKEQLLENPKMKLFCLEDNAAVFKQMAEQMAEEIKAHNAEGKHTVFICPVGPVGQYPYFVDLVKSRISVLKMYGLSIWTNIWMMRSAGRRRITSELSGLYEPYRI